jgi:hypothetical protein
MGWLLAGAVGLAALVTPLAGADPVAALRGGGSIVYFRHADTDWSRKDRPG